MGSGQSAAYSSEICGMFLQKMLASGNRKETALKMLNNLLRARGEECSATVDLLEIDLEEGNANLLKSGAAPTFVRRGDKLYKLRSSTVPIGILPSLSAEDINFALEEGDVLIMMSDGVSQSPEECLWLMELMGGIWDKDETPSGMAEKICRKAKDVGSCDDITALLDVTWPEPPVEGHPFYTLENCLLTPHIAGSAGDEVCRMAEYMLEECKAYLSDEPCKYEVSLRMLETMA
jgi:stage II sporulation protein E